MASYPDNLSYYLKRMRGYTRINTRILPMTARHATFGETVMFRLPAGKLIDLSTWAVHGDFLLNSVTAHCPCRIGRDTASFIRRMQVTVGGQTIQDLDHYNVIWQALKQLRCDKSATASEKYSEWDRQFTVGGSDSQHHPDTNEDLGDGVDHQFDPFVIRKWLGFFEASPSIIDTRLTGEIVITLTLDSDARNFAQGTELLTLQAALKEDSGLRNLFSSIDVIQVGDEIYNQIMNQAMLSGSEIEIPVPNYYTFSDTANSFRFESRFRISCQSLDACMCLLRRRNRELFIGAAEDGHGGVGDVTHSKTIGWNSATYPFYTIQQGLRFDGTPATNVRGDGWQWDINGASVPEYRVSRDDTFHLMKVAFEKDGCKSGNLVGADMDLNYGSVSHDFYKQYVYDRHWIPVVRFSHNSSDKRLIGGLDARERPLQVTFKCVGSGPYVAHAHRNYKDSGVEILNVALCTSVLCVHADAAGQEISFSA